MSDYRAPAYLPGGHCQTILGSLSLWPRLGYESERFWFDDPHAPAADRGDFIDVDWAGRKDARNLLVLFHGLEGNSGGLYARKLGAHALGQGWRFAVPHFRGCSRKGGARERNLQLRSYHAGASDQIERMLRHCAERHGAPVFAAGISLGANMLLKWLGETGADAGKLVRRAVAISPPLDLHVTGSVLARGFSLFYAKLFLRTLYTSALEKLRRFPGAYDEGSVRKARTLREFDDAVTARVHGFRDVEDYYTQSSSRSFLQGIRVPTLILSARNDPFTPDEVLRSVEALQRGGQLPAQVTLDFQKEGGHVSFPGDRGWLQRRVFEFLSRSLERGTGAKARSSG
jgi:uncharacterized protein